MKSYKMPTESLQALHTDFSELHSPDSLYTKDLSELLPDEIKLKTNSTENFDLQESLKFIQDEHTQAHDEKVSLQDLMDTYNPGTNQVLAAPIPQQSCTDIGRASSDDLDLPPTKVLVREADDSASQMPFMSSQDMVTDVFTYRQPSPISSPDTTVFSDNNTHLSESLLAESTVMGSSADTRDQVSLCQQSKAMCLDSAALNNEQSPLWVLLSDANNVKAEASSPISTSPLASPHKARKASFESDAPSSHMDSTSNGELFDAGSAVSSAQYVFTKFGSEVPGIFTFGGQTSASEASGVGNTVSSKAVTSLSRTPSDMAAMLVEDETIFVPPVVPVKEASLNTTFPSKAGNMELKVVVQPEDQHRARYMTEGSRGAIKDRSQNSHPVIQLKGYNKPATIKIFIGTDSGRIKPHGFYQACRVCGKNNTPCTERDINGTTVIEVVADPKEDMSVKIDCVGILKLRNADVEQRIGIQRSKKKSTRVRMVFRVDVPRNDGSHLTLQTSSTAISCTQPAGQPEVCKKSLNQCSVKGGEDLFIIGKNFTKGSKVLLQQRDADDQVTWSAEAPVDQDYFQPTHLICTLPAYHNENVTEDIEVSLVVQCNDRLSEPVPFTYTRGMC